MAITLESNYSKKIGLPGYSSHQYSLTVRTEVSDLGQVVQESNRLYTLLQQSVDREIQTTGFLPGHHNEAGATHRNHGNGNGHYRNGRSVRPAPSSDAWQCSAKQQELILKLVQEQNLPKERVETLAQDRFGKGVRQLNKLEASGLIEELMENSRKTPSASPQ